MILFPFIEIASAPAPNSWFTIINKFSAIIASTYASSPNGSPFLSTICITIPSPSTSVLPSALFNCSNSSCNNSAVFSTHNESTLIAIS